jgi:hypothetical protein
MGEAWQSQKNKTREIVSPTHHKGAGFARMTKEQNIYENIVPEILGTMCKIKI